MRISFTLYRKFLFLSLLCVFVNAERSHAQSLRFTDTSYINLGNAASLHLTNFTLEAWIKIEGHSSTTETGSTGAGGGQVDIVPVITKGRAQSETAAQDVNYFLGYRRSDMKLIADFEDNATSLNHSAVSIGTLAMCTWTHIAASYNTATDTWKLYINGALDNTISAGGNFTPQSLSNVNACIGSSLNSGNIRPGFFNGRIDEARIWSVPRTDAEILANYNIELLSGTGLVGRWGLNEGSGALAANSVSGGPNGSLLNFPLWVSGFNQSDPVTNASLNFNGVHDYITFGVADGTAGNPSLNATSFTLEAWIKIEGPGVTTTSGTGGITAVPIIAKGRGESETSNRNMNYLFGIDATNKLVADFEESSGPNHPATSIATIPTGKWTHVAVSYGAGSWKIYINGALDNTESEGSAVPVGNSIQHASIGTAITSSLASPAAEPAGFFNGKIDEVRIWNAVRTAAEISANYMNELTSGTGLIGRWGFNENCNTTANNTVAGGATGTIRSTNISTHPTNGGPSWVASAFNVAPNQPSDPFPANNGIAPALSPNICATVSDPNGGSNLRAKFYGRKKNVVNTSKFSIIWLPDTQFYTEEPQNSPGHGNNSIFKSQTNWIVANKSALNIVYAGELGDCVQNGDNNGNDIEWRRADTSLKIIEDPVTTSLPDGIPYGVAVGNHDQGATGAAGDPTAATNFYNQYFGKARFNGRGYYGGHFGINSDNHYELFSGGGIDFIAISMEFDGTATMNIAVLNWADNLLKQYSMRKAIIYCHYIVNANGTFGTQGNNIFNKLKNNPNLLLMVSGHIHDEARRTDLADDGHVVNSVLSDYQARALGGGGLLRIFEFDPVTNTIDVKTYSPYLGIYETDASSQFVLNTNLSGANSFSLIGELNNVTSGSVACMAWPTLEQLTDYEWYVELTDGEYTTNSPVWTFTTPPSSALPVSLLGFTAQTENKKVKINWTTTYERDNSHFEVERSRDGVTFSKIASVAGRNNSTGLQNYSAYDDQPLKGTSFYRLKQVDIDKQFTYSKVVSVNLFDPNGGIEIYPNPVIGNSFSISLYNAVNGKVHVSVYDMTGSLQLQKQYEGANNITINHRLRPGAYMIKVITEKFTENKKLIIK